jgi:hypothetical protein
MRYGSAEYLFVAPPSSTVPDLPTIHPSTTSRPRGHCCSASWTLVTKGAWCWPWVEWS